MTDESSQPGATAPETEPGPAAVRGAGAGDVPATGEPRVDEALAALAGLGEAPGAGHVEAFEDVHRKLSAILGEAVEPEKPGQGDPRSAGPRGPGGR